MTVCPPKNTFTDLNYVLWKALEESNTSISEETLSKREFVKAIELSELENFKTFMENIYLVFRKDLYPHKEREKIEC